MGCCDDPTEPLKINRNDVARVQEQYGNLMRDLFTSDPEKVMLKELKAANNYIKELAALNAHFDSVRKQAIGLLGKESVAVLQQIIDKETDSEIGLAAKQRIEELDKDQGLFAKIFN